MKKLICLLLCVCLVCPFGLTCVMAAEATADTVLFSYDFETGTIVGDNVPIKEETFGMWTSRVDSATSKIKVAEDTTQGRVAMYSNTATSNGGPRLQKTLYLNPTACTAASHQTNRRFFPCRFHSSAPPHWAIRAPQ